MSPAPPPLAVTCKQTNCSPNVRPAARRHSFLTLAESLPSIGGTCRNCGADVVDWDRCHQRDPNDVDALVADMRKELIRDVYWGEPLPKRIRRLALARSSDALKTSHGKLLRRELTPPQSENPWLQMHTYYGHKKGARIVHCAQHATATCCRNCLEQWHGIPREQRLTDAELNYFEGLTWRYTEQRLAEPAIDEVEDARAA
jgi:Domain of unknown function (DUF4186)